MLQKFRLNFTDDAKEAAFRQEHLRRSLNIGERSKYPRSWWAGPTRFTILLGAILYAIFIVSDVLLYEGDELKGVLLIRVIVIPTILFFFVLTFYLRSEKTIQWILSVGSAVAGLGILAMVFVVMAAPENPPYYIGLMLVFMMLVPLRLRFTYAAATGLFVLAAYIVVACWIRPMDYERFIYHTFHISAAFITSSLSSYLLEWYARQTFAQKLIVEKQKQTQSNFFQGVAHSFNSPLTTALGPLQDLHEGVHGELSSKAKTQLERALRSTQEIRRQVRRLLDVAKGEQVRIQALAGNISHFAEQTAEDFALRAEQENITLDVDVPDAPLIAYYDPSRMKDIVKELLENAFRSIAEKFQEGGGLVRLSVWQEAINPDTGGEGASAKIAVQDNGTGIPSEVSRRIFERFFSARNQPTTGLGLLLVRQYVSQHKGSVEVESREGFGSTFTVTLPLGRAHLQESEITEPDERIRSGAELRADFPTDADLPQEESTTKFIPYKGGRDGSEEVESVPKVLVIDNDAGIRSLVCEHLERSNYNVVEARNGTEGLQKAEAESPHLIIADIRMPGMTGTELCRQLKSGEELNHIPVIMMTAYHSFEREIESLDVGADFYLSKPFDYEKLMAIVENCLRRHHLLKNRYGEVLKLRFGYIEETVHDPQLKTFIKRATEATIEGISSKHDFKVGDLASKMAKSDRTLLRWIKKIDEEMTTEEFIESIRLDCAKEQIEHGDTEEEAAKKAGISVTDLRKHLRQDN